MMNHKIALRIVAVNSHFNLKKSYVLDELSIALALATAITISTITITITLARNKYYYYYLLLQSLLLPVCFNYVLPLEIFSYP